MAKLTELNEGQAVQINDVEYKVVQKGSQEGMSQIILLNEAEGKAAAIIYPDGKEDELKVFALESHGDHFHMGAEINKDDVKVKE